LAGDIVHIMPNHDCMVVNMVNRFVTVCGSKIVGVLPGAAHGRLT
jgi:D-serine deaminase-like pyridoxal phosphate-dependent protein